MTARLRLALIATVRLAVMCLLGSSLLAPTRVAAETTVWRHASAADFESGTGEGITVGAHGELQLGHALELVADLKVGAVWDLVRDAQGRLVATTSSPGRVVRLNDKGEPEDLLADEAAMAFSLLARPDGSLLVGLGPTGKILKIAADGKVSTFAALEDALYVWDLVAGDDGSIYAGTGPNGRVVRLDATGAEKQHWTLNSHVVSLALSGDGKVLYAGTDAGLLEQLPLAGGFGRTFNAGAKTEVRGLTRGDDGAIYAGVVFGDGVHPTGDAPTVFRFAQNAAAAAPFETLTGAAYASTPDDVYALTPWGGEGALLVGAAPKGVLRLVGRGRPSSVVGRVDAEQILCFQATKSEVYLGTGNTGKIYRLSRGHRQQGEFHSKPIDAQLAARFGSVSWQGETPTGTKISLAVRSGDTAEPDDHWSDWSKELATSGEASGVPPARYLQYRVTLAATDPSVTPIVRSVTIRGRTLNLPPAVTEITVPHIEDGDGKTRQEKLKITWKASDPNKDELRYTLAFRQLDWDAWVTLPDELKSEEYDWDATALPAGVYLVRITASDRLTRSPEEAGVGSLDSAPFVVDHEAPKLSIQAPPTPVSPRVALTAQDDQTPIVRAAYSLDGGAWTSIFPEDGLFDQPKETFLIELSDLKPGRHVLVMRATDAAGFVGSESVVFSLNGAAVQPGEVKAATPK